MNFAVCILSIWQHNISVEPCVGAVVVPVFQVFFGVWGTLACSLFGAEAVLKTASDSSGLFYGGGFRSLGIQLLGIVSYGSWAFILGLLTFTVIKKTIGLRVSEDEERKGLDITEHGNDAYARFQVFMNE